MKLSFNELAQCLEARIFHGASVPESISRVSTDTRSLQPGECYVALKGDKFDGHDYVAEAVERGASCVVVEREFLELGSVTQLVVRDTLYALGEMARLWRSQNAQIPLAVVTGSSGKTTTKEMAAAIVGASRRVLVTHGNFNNLIGVPKMLFEMQPEHEAVILELGMNSPGELTRLVEIAQPQCVALTNITNAHIGMFGSQERLYQAKTESLRQAGPETVLVLNAEDPLSRRARQEFARGRKVLSFGLKGEALVHAGELEKRTPYGYAFELFVDGQAPAGVELKIFGRHNVANALAAAALASFFGLKTEAIARGLNAFRPAGNRSEVTEIRGCYVVKDYYNASPAAVEQALRSLADFEVPGRRFAVLADMLELGELEREYHEAIGKTASQAGLEKLFTLGERGAIIHQSASSCGMKAEHLGDAQAVAEKLKSELRPGDLLLIKGSRLMKLEKIYELLAL